MLSQGHNSKQAINVEGVISSQNDIRYGDVWQRATTGKELITMTFPTTLPRGSIQLIYSLPTAMKGQPIIKLADIPKLKYMPPESTIEEARAMLSKANEEHLQDGPCSSRSPTPWGVLISNFGFIKPNILLMLPRVYQAKEFTRNLLSLLGWINDVVSELDDLFSMWLEDILLKKPGIMHYKFPSTPTSDISVRSLCFLCGENFVDDDSVRAIMAMMAECYGADKENLFIPPLVLEGWRRSMQSSSAAYGDWEWEIEIMRSGRVQKVFAIVYMRQHWGAFYVNLTKKTIDFGDSLAKRAPEDAVKALIRWLEVVGHNASKWSSICGNFNVPRQPAASGSCAINAANTIERVFNTEVERWTHKRSAYHRVRYMRLLTGFYEVSNAI